MAVARMPGRRGRRCRMGAARVTGPLRRRLRMAVALAGVARPAGAPDSRRASGARRSAGLRTLIARRWLSWGRATGVGMVDGVAAGTGHVNADPTQHLAGDLLRGAGQHAGERCAAHRCEQAAGEGERPQHRPARPEHRPPGPGRSWHGPTRRGRPDTSGDGGHRRVLAGQLGVERGQSKRGQQQIGSRLLQRIERDGRIARAGGPGSPAMPRHLLHDGRSIHHLRALHRDP